METIHTKTVLHPCLTTYIGPTSITEKTEKTLNILQSNKQPWTDHYTRICQTFLWPYKNTWPSICTAPNPTQTCIKWSNFNPVPTCQQPTYMYKYDTSHHQYIEASKQSYAEMLLIDCIQYVTGQLTLNKSVDELSHTLSTSLTICRRVV